ncbi:CHAT domain containing protein [Lactarius tabidus]
MESPIEFETTLPEIDEFILEHHRLLESLPRPNSNRPALLCLLATLRAERNALSDQKSDLDKTITHLTEAVLLSQTQDIVYAFFRLAVFLLYRFEYYEQRDDVKSSIECFRLLRINFHSLEAFDIPHSIVDLPSHLFLALAINLVFTPGDMVQDMGDMVALIPEFITTDILTDHQEHAILTLGLSVIKSEIFRREVTQQVANQAIQVLREATVRNPNLAISFALAGCLAARFDSMPAMNDYDEAIAIADRIVATHSPGNSLTTIQKKAMVLISDLLVSRFNSFSRPEYLEDAILRIRTFVSSLPSLDDDRTDLANVLTVLTHERFRYFGVNGNSGGIPPNPHSDLPATWTRRVLQPASADSQDIGTRSQMEENQRHLRDIAIAIDNGEITDVEAAVERSRKLLPLQQSRDRWSLSSEPAAMFAHVLVQAYRSTKRPDYLNEAITRYRDLREVPAPQGTRFDVEYNLHQCLIARLPLCNLQEDVEELLQLSPEVANNSSGEVFTRFQTSNLWAAIARGSMHPSASMAYEMGMSLLQETLVFCPTLQTQHLRLAQTFSRGARLPSDYASYQIENGQVKQAIETLERGRVLIWSEMRGLRTSTDQLRAANAALADKFTDINRRLESVTMSVALSNDNDKGDSETGTESGTERCEDSIGHLVLTQRRLLEERDSLISHVQSLPGLENFLKSPPFDVLNSAASLGPVIIINECRFGFPSHIILLVKDSPPSLISTPPDIHDRADQLENELLRIRKEKGPGSRDYELTLASVLSDLYELIGKPVIERFSELKVPEKSRVWWCPTGAFCSLPLHAMGPITSADDNEMYFSDLYIPSYTPSLSALIESRKRGSLSEAFDNLKPSILLVAQPDTLPGADGEIKAIKATKNPVKTLISAKATPETVLEGLREHRFAHFVCHGLLETGKPFDAALELHKDNLTLLAIVQSQLPAAEFAFLSACHTAELTEGSAADEGLHLAAAMQYCGFRSVVGTMWAMADTDGVDLSKTFYKAIFLDKVDKTVDQTGVPYHERSARALQIAVQKLRKKRGITLERWVNFVHYGA